VGPYGHYGGYGAYGHGAYGYGGEPLGHHPGLPGVNPYTLHTSTVADTNNPLG